MDAFAAYNDFTWATIAEPASGPTDDLVSVLVFQLTASG